MAKKDLDKSGFIIGLVGIAPIVLLFITIQLSSIGRGYPSEIIGLVGVPLVFLYVTIGVPLLTSLVSLIFGIVTIKSGFKKYKSFVMGIILVSVFGTFYVMQIKSRSAFEEFDPEAYAICNEAYHVCLNEAGIAATEQGLPSFDPTPCLKKERTCVKNEGVWPAE